MPETVVIDGREVETHNKEAFSDYRSKWDREEDVEEVDEENFVAPQYSINFPSAGEYPDEVYENTGCIPVEEAREQLAIGKDVLFWTGPPCNENSYLTTSTVRSLPPIEYHRPEKETIKSNDHVACHNGQNMGKMFGPIQWDVRVDCIVALGDDVQVVD